MTVPLAVAAYVLLPWVLGILSLLAVVRFLTGPYHPEDD